MAGKKKRNLRPSEGQDRPNQQKNWGENKETGKETFAYGEAGADGEEGHGRRLKTKKGCNCPFGCLKGEPIPAGARQPPPGAVCVRCSNENCPAVPWQHGVCYDKWEKHLIRILMNTRTSSRKHSEHETRRGLWNQRYYDLIHQYCHCTACKGYLSREAAEEKLLGAAASGKLVKAKAQKSASKELPKLVTRNPVGLSSSYVSQRHHLAGKVDPSNRRRGMSPSTSFSMASSSAATTDTTSNRDSDSSYRCIGRLHDDSKENFVNDFFEKESWPDLPRSRTVSEQSSDTSSLDGLVAAGGVPHETSGLTKPHFLKDLESLVRIYDGCLPQDHPVVADLMQKVEVTLMSEIWDFGGFAHWLSLNSEKMRVLRGEILLKALQNVPNQINGVGTVIELLETEDGMRNRGVIQSTQFGNVNIWFDSGSEFADGATEFFKNDIVSFLAVETKSPIRNCRWLVVEMFVLQRAASLADVRLSSDTETQPKPSVSPAVQKESAVGSFPENLNQVILGEKTQRGKTGLVESGEQWIEVKGKSKTNIDFPSKFSSGTLKKPRDPIRKQASSTLRQPTFDAPENVVVTKDVTAEDLPWITVKGKNKPERKFQLLKWSSGASFGGFLKTCTADSEEEDWDTTPTVLPKGFPINLASKPSLSEHHDTADQWKKDKDWDWDRGGYCRINSRSSQDLDGFFVVDRCWAGDSASKKMDGEDKTCLEEHVDQSSRAETCSPSSYHTAVEDSLDTSLGSTKSVVDTDCAFGEPKEVPSAVAELQKSVPTAVVAPDRHEKIVEHLEVVAPEIDATTAEGSGQLVGNKPPEVVTGGAHEYAKMLEEHLGMNRKTEETSDLAEWEKVLQELLQ